MSHGDPRRLMLVAVEDGEVVAHLVGVLEDPSVMHVILVANLRSLFVRPSHRDRGLGSELVRHFRAWAREHDAQRLSVTAYATNTSGLRFYQRHGFVPHEVLLIAPADG